MGKGMYSPLKSEQTLNDLTAATAKWDNWQHQRNQLLGLKPLVVKTHFLGEEEIQRFWYPRVVHFITATRNKATLKDSCRAFKDSANRRVPVS